MKIFANPPMKAIIIAVAAIVVTLASVHHHKKVEAARQAREAAVQQAKKAEAARVRVDARQLKCLADNIYYEAGNQGTLGQAAVGRVVVNRVKHGFGANVCDVVYKKTRYVQQTEDGESVTRTLCQFSWVCVAERGVVHKKNYAQAHEVAYKIITADAYRDVVPSNTLYFHAVHVSPNWGLQRVRQINQHIFYSNKRVKTQE